ncbi:MAG TPA: zinc-binding dehydrogenase [Gemmatimonadales bacterium]|nr:zinc-binding dehydrogenase [Gemmatimonadales bacterium]
MLAVTIRSHGGPEVVAVEDVARPRVEGPNDVVVALKAAALNHLDLFVVRGLPGRALSFPHVLGADGAGVVEAVGPAVTRVKPGDRVLLNPGVSCQACDFCLAGEQSLCTTYRLLGEHLPGTMAEAVRVGEWNVHPLPGRVSWADAAAFPLVHLTAWRMLVTRAAVRPGETVLIWGIGGGVALAALGIAKLLGAVAIVTSSSDAKLERARALGADLAVNHVTTDVPKELRRLLGARGVNVVVDSVGEATWEKSLRALAPGGRLVTCGGTSGPKVVTDVRRMFWYHHTLMGSTMGNAREFAEIVRLLGAGSLRPVVDGVTPIRDARRALERLASGAHFGKLVVEIAA